MYIYIYTHIDDRTCPSARPQTAAPPCARPRASWRPINNNHNNHSINSNNNNTCIIIQIIVITIVILLIIITVGDPPERVVLGSP